jgi:hypothetical protein
MKVKVKVASQTVQSKKPQTVSAKSPPTSIFPSMPKMNRVEHKRTKSIFGKMAYVIIEDVKSIFHKDNKTKEEKMKYEAFMEMCQK